MYLLTRMVIVFPSNSLSVSLGLNYNSLDIFTHMWENLKLKKRVNKIGNYLISVLTSSLSDNITLGEVILWEVIISSPFCNQKCKLDKSQS